MGGSRTPEIPIVQVRTCAVRRIRVAFFLFTLGRRRAFLVLVAGFGPFGCSLPFRSLFALGLSCDIGDIPDFSQKLAEDHLRRHTNVFGRI